MGRIPQLISNEGGKYIGDLQILFYVFCIHPLGSSLYIAVEHFIGKFASPAANSVTAIVNSIDESL